MRLAALLYSRLCHDVIGPISAVANGVELLTEQRDTSDGDEALALIALSAGEASRRVQFYRLAFGGSGGIGAPGDLGAARRAAASLVEGSRVQLQWPPEGEPAEVSADAVKLVLNMVLLAIEAVPRGGRVTVTTSASKVLDIVIAAEGPGARLKEATSRALHGEVAIEECDARLFQSLYADLLARALGGDIRVERAEDSITFVAGERGAKPPA